MLRVLVCLTLLGWVTDAAACTCRTVFGKDAVKAADLVVRGRVVEVKAGNLVERGGSFVLEVSRAWKGPARRRVTIAVGSMCGMGLPAVGTEWIYFAYGSAKTGWLAPPCAGSEQLDPPQPPPDMATLFDPEMRTRSILTVIGTGRPVKAR